MRYVFEAYVMREVGEYGDLLVSFFVVETEVGLTLGWAFFFFSLLVHSLSLGTESVIGISFLKSKVGRAGELRD